MVEKETVGAVLFIILAISVLGYLYLKPTLERTYLQSPYTQPQTNIIILFTAIFFGAIISLFALAFLLDLSEKEQIIVLALIEICILGVFFSVVDPILGGGIIQYKEQTEIVKYWFLMPLIYGFIAVSVSLASLLGDYHSWSNEDYMGAILLIATPFLVVMSGLMDWLSASVIEWHWYGVFAKNFPWVYEWWWLDYWSIPYWISRLLGYEHTQYFTIPIGIGITSIALILLWIVYYEYS